VVLVVCPPFLFFFPFPAVGFGLSGSTAVGDRQEVTPLQAGSPGESLDVAEAGAFGRSVRCACGPAVPSSGRVPTVVPSVGAGAGGALVGDPAAGICPLTTGKPLACPRCPRARPPPPPPPQAPTLSTSTARRRGAARPRRAASASARCGIWRSSPKGTATGSRRAPPRGGCPPAPAPPARRLSAAPRRPTAPRRRPPPPPAAAAAGASGPRRARRAARPPAGRARRRRAPRPLRRRSTRRGGCGRGASPTLARCWLRRPCAATGGASSARSCGGAHTMGGGLRVG